MKVKVAYFISSAVVAASIALILGFTQTSSQTTNPSLKEIAYNNPLAANDATIRGLTFTDNDMSTSANHANANTKPISGSVSAPATSLPKNSMFLATGDWGCKAPAASTVSTAVKFNPDLVLALGDLSYQGNTDCWEKIIKPIFSKTRIVIGNHDVVDPEMTANYTRDFNLKNQYYSFNYNDVHVVVLSSEIAYGTSSSQYAFVKQDLAQAASNSSINWIIAAVHKPMYTSSSNQPAPTDLRAAYSPLFDKYGVDLVLAGHNHNYQRTYPLGFNAAKPGTPLIKSFSKTCYNDPSGPVYLISGAAGQSHAYLGSQKSFVIKQFSDKYGVSKIDISNIQNSSGQTGTIMSVAFYQNGNLGTAIDPFKITKGAAASNIC